MYKETSIKAIIQKLMPKQNEIIVGRIISENPLKVQAENDEKLVLNKNSLIVPARLSDIGTGEYLHILVLNGGKKYYALDKAVM
ncbi:MAG: DUF2577 family protein [Porcipelethomonas sp.]